MHGINISSNTTLNFAAEARANEYALCYESLDTVCLADGRYTVNWDIFLNNAEGTARKNITNWKYSDLNPSWSSDGRYIVFRRDGSTIGGGSDLFLYDVTGDTCYGLLVSDIYDTNRPGWTPDSKKIIYEYHEFSYPAEWHIVDVTGENDKKLQHQPAFFYPDSYTYLYRTDSSLCKTTIDNSYTETVLDLKSLNGYAYGFDPLTEEVLLTFPEDTCSGIEIYHLDTDSIEVIFIEKPGFYIGNLSWLSEKNRIAFFECSKNKQNSSVHETLSVLADGLYKKLVNIVYTEEKYSSFG